MRGHESIFAIRQAGQKPRAVFVSDLPNVDVMGHVAIEPNDIPEALDLRFLVGLECHVSVFDTPKGRRIADACKAACGRCICAFYQPGVRLCTRITDTEGDKEWKF